MLNQQETNSTIKRLFETALFKYEYFAQEEITVEYQQLWIKEVRSIPWFHQVLEDLEDYVEHHPASKKRRISHILFLDYTILTYDKECEESLKCRKVVLEQFKLTNEQIEKEVKKYFTLHKA